jgi:uncharacterized protein YkwD
LLALTLLAVGAILLIGRLRQPAASISSAPEALMTHSAEATGLIAAVRRKGADTSTPAKPTATKTPTGRPRSERTPTESPRPGQTPAAGRTPQPPSKTPRATPSAAAAAIQSELYERINRIRRDAGLADLTPSAGLAEAAQAHAADMASRQVLSHTGADGSDVAMRIRRTGYKPAAWGEIIASVTGGPDEAVQAWWNSAPHREIMLGADFREFGAGRVKRRGDVVEYYVVVFVVTASAVGVHEND